MTDKPISLNNWTYDHIKNKILNLEIKPGDQIHIDEVTKKLEVSRTPVREAFLRLANENLIDIKPRVGYFVSEITEKNILDIFEIRKIFETRAALKSIEKITDFELQTIKKLLLECEKKVENGNPQCFVEVDIKFHEFIQEQIQNKFLSEFMQSMNDLTYRIRIMSLRSKENIDLSIIEHQNILESLTNRDPEKIDYYICDHLEKVCKRMISLFKERRF